MNRYACYIDDAWQFNISAENEELALASARALQPRITRVVLVAESKF